MANYYQKKTDAQKRTGPHVYAPGTLSIGMILAKFQNTPKNQRVLAAFLNLSVFQKINVREVWDESKNCQVLIQIRITGSLSLA